jgi:hypothetical protein
VAGRRDTAAIDAPAEAGNSGFQELELIEDALHVLDPEPPDPRCAGIFRGKVHRPRVEMGRLNHHEAVSGPEVCQWAVTVQGRTMAVREDDDRQFVPACGCGHPNQQVFTAARCW